MTDMSEVTHSDVVYQTVLTPAAHWSFKARKHTRIRLTDMEGGANLGGLFYNPDNLLERYNAPDTLKCQHTFKLNRGHCLYSDMGRIFCSITEDTLGWHDTVAGNSTRALVEQKWGEINYQQARNDWQQNGHDSFLVELAKYGLGKKDLAANLNLFSKVSVDNKGAMRLAPAHSQAGDSLVLRFEMDTLVVMHTCPHPLSEASEYPRKPVKVEFLTPEIAGVDDFCQHSCAENERGFANNALYHHGCS